MIIIKSSIALAIIALLANSEIMLPTYGLSEDPDLRKRNCKATLWIDAVNEHRSLAFLGERRIGRFSIACSLLFGRPADDVETRCWKANDATDGWDE
jgi:hypothetical protein